VSTFRSVRAIATVALALAACTPPDASAPTTPAVPMQDTTKTRQLVQPKHNG